MRKKFVCIALPLLHCTLASAQSSGSNVDTGSKWSNELENLEFELRDFDPEWSGRVFSVSNISLVITYVTLVVAAVMLAGFIWLAFAFSGAKEEEGYGHENAYGYSRTGRSFDDDQDLARRLHFILESFRKQKIVDTGCQLLFACHSSQRKNPFQNKIDKIIKDTNIEDVYDPPGYLVELILAHKIGEENNSDCLENYAISCPRSMQKIP